MPEREGSYMRYKPSPVVQVFCQTCGTSFARKQSVIQMGIKRHRGHIFCSFSCSTHFQKGFPLVRFYEYIEKPITLKKCWNWIGRIDHKGYGSLYADGAQVSAHRYSYKIHIGPIPDGLWILHKNSCHNRRCVNPDHIYAGTAKDNTRDMIEGLFYVPVPIHRGEKSSSAKLTENDVYLIRSLYTKEHWSTIAKRFNISRSTVYTIWNKRTWKHL